jgi:pyruvate dehydrogenase E2 component (dihydrolipoamide acetyltransferase)
MPIKITMPALSPTMEKGNLVKWHKKEGDKIEAGVVFAEIETDKATMEVEAVDEGILGKIVIPEGTMDVKVNTVIAMLLEEGESDSVIKDMDLGDEVEVSIKESQKKQEEQIEQPSVDIQIKKTFASPLAQRISEQSSIDISAVEASGSRQKVMKDDVLAYIKNQESQYSGAGMNLSTGEVKRISPEFSESPISNIRKIIAQKLSETKQQVPHFYLSMDCDISKMLIMRAEINSATNPESPSWKLSVNDLVIKAVAMALKQVPDANSTWTDKALVKYSNVDISVAVAIKGGLITPIVKNADQKSVFFISQEIRELVKKARDGVLKPKEFQGGSATVSNLGMYGIKQFSAIVNPPQSCIFAIGAAQQIPAVLDGEIKITSVMNVTLSCDHRIVDGAVGASLLKAFKRYIENPSRLLL